VAFVLGGSGYRWTMKPWMIALLAGFTAAPLAAEIRTERDGGLLEQDPEVVYLDRHFDEEFQLKVIKQAPVFSDKEGQYRLGAIKAGQTVKLEAMTERAYRVRGEGTRDGIAGWVAPWAFEPTWKDDDFVGNLKKLYQRQQEVKKLIAGNEVAIGMTLAEVAMSRGEPTKTKVRRTEKGQSGKWEYIDYEEVKHYNTVRDPLTGGVFRTLAYVSQEERGKTVVEFDDDVVTAIEESENRGGGSVRIIVPPVAFGWWGR
jgi:hypothetical protein